MKRVVGLLAVGSLAAFTVGCAGPTDSLNDLEAPDFGDREAQVDNPRADTPGFVTGTLEIESAELSGTIGTIGNFEDIVSLEGWNESTYASVFTTAVGPEGAGMSIIEVSGGFSHTDLEPGTSHTFTNEDYPEYGELYVHTIGCSGDDVGDWDFDREADQTTISVDESPDDSELLEVRYTSRFSNWDDTERSVVGGAFTIRQ